MARSVRTMEGEMGRAISFTESVVLHVPPERIFAFMIDPANASHVDPSFVYWQPEKLPPEVGTLNHLKMRGPLGLSIKATSRFAEFDPPHRFVLESVKPTYPVFLRGIHDFLPLDGGTRYVYTVELWPRRGGTLPARALRRFMQRSVRIGARRLPDLLAGSG